MTDDDSITVVHPRVVQGKHPPAAVDVGEQTVPLGPDGKFEVPLAKGEWIAGVAEAHGVDVEAITDTCLEAKDDGEVCGRDLPCRYHSETNES